MTDTRTLKPGQGHDVPAPANVYLLWWHQENGPQYLVATLDRDKVVQMALEQCRQEEDKDEVFKNLREILSKTDEELLQVDENLWKKKADQCRGIWETMNGWGGLHFQVVKLK